MVYPETTFGLVIRRIRRWRDMTQDELAHQSGIDRTFLSKIERGVNQPTLTTMLQLADALQLDPAELMMRMVSLVQGDHDQKETLCSKDCGALN